MNTLFWSAGIIVALIFLYVMYDRVMWYAAKYEESKVGVVKMAEDIMALRDMVENSDLENWKEYSKILQRMQVENARVSYTLGGVKLLDKVTRTEPAPIKTETIIVEEDSRKIQVV